MTSAADWPLTGRGEELARVRAGLRAGRHVALVGVAGVGKSRLAAEATVATAARRIVASPSAVPVPLAALSSLVPTSTPESAVAEVLALVGEGGTLVVDDAHHLDDASATVVHQLGVSGRLRLVLTIRAGLSLPAALSPLLREAGLDRIELGVLAPEDVDALLRRALGGPVEGQTLHRLVTLSGGNPLFLRELALGSLAAGTLVEEAGLYRFHGDMAATPVLEETVLARVDARPPDEVEAIELLAVAGEVGLDLVSVAITAAVLERLERAGLVTARSEGGVTQVGLAHPLYGELVRARLGELTVARCSAVLAEAADKVEIRDGRVTAPELQVVQWHRRAGNEVDAERLVRAAQQARDAGDARLGADLGRAAFLASGDAPSALVGAWGLARQGDHAGALTLLLDASTVADDPWVAAALRTRAAEERLWWERDVAGAEALLAGCPAGPAEAMIEAQRAVFAVLDGRTADAVTRAEALVDHEHPGVRFSALIALEQGLAAADRGDEAFALATDAYDEFAGQAGDLLGVPSYHVVGQMLGLVQAGRLEEARGLGELVYAVAVGNAELESRGWAALLVGLAALVAGELTLATERFTEAELLLVEAGLTGVSRWAAGGVALAAHQQGRAADGDAALARAERRRADGFRAFEPSIVLAGAWRAAADGRLADAERAGLAAARLADAGGSWVHVAHAAHDLGRLGQWDGAVEALVLLPGSDGPLTAARRRFVDGGAAADADGLEEAADAFVALGAALFAAEALALAAGLRGGRAAAPLHARAASLLSACPGAATPPLRDVSASARLSAREAEVARLAAAGRTNREIADALTVSERTVENHLYRAFTKLGVSDRGELAGALSTGPPGG